MQNNSASITYMFDAGRTGRLLFKKGDLKEPKLLWKVRLPNNPPMSPESTAVMDQEGNIYFGCHDGRVYSLKACGAIRWFVQTQAKIYGTLALCQETQSVYATSCDGFTYSITFDGTLKWKSKIYIDNFTEEELRNYNYHKSNSHTLHEVNRMASAKSWSSPILKRDLVFTIGYGAGLSAISKQNGHIVWQQFLGFPCSYLSSPSINKNDEIVVVGQQGMCHKFDLSGQLIWKRNLDTLFNFWSTPVICPETQNIFLVASIEEENAELFCLNNQGDILWREVTNGGCRGSMSLSYENYVLFCSYDGYLKFFKKETGQFIKEVKVSEENLWTSAGIDTDGNIFVNCIHNHYGEEGGVVCLNKQGHLIWKVATGRGHSIPVIDENGYMYVGAWNGCFYCFKT